ncbi:MAG: hypothetical protein AAGF59_05485 [Pseudomonadota bacterium]
MQNNDTPPPRSRFLARLSKMQAELAVGLALVLAAGGFTIAQMQVDLPFQWCPTGTIDRVECFRGWLLPLAGWIAAFVAYVTIRQIRKQVDSLEAEVEQHRDSERQSALRMVKNAIANFQALDGQLHGQLTEAIRQSEQSGRIHDDTMAKARSVLSQMAHYPWSQFEDTGLFSDVGAQADLLKAALTRLETSMGDDRDFAEKARHYLFVRDLFYERIAEKTGLDPGES